MRKIIFGGTFDPVHNGHLALAREVLARGIADKVIFVPAYIPPHKTEKAVTDYGIRYKLLKEAIKDEPRFEISDIENKRGGKSYTIDTLRSMSKLFPDDCILLLIGADSLRQLHTWSRPKELVREFELACYPRRGEAPAAEELKEHWTEDEIRKLLSCVIPDAPCFDVSSTEIRKLLAECPDSAKDMIPPAVFECIRKNSYYKL